jgi:hypothetical protein
MLELTAWSLEATAESREPKKEWARFRSDVQRGAPHAFHPIAPSVAGETVGQSWIYNSPEDRKRVTGSITGTG